MIIDDKDYPAILQMVFANPQRKLLLPLFGLMMIFVYYSHNKTLLDV